jgi:hypothetical protein
VLFTMVPMSFSEPVAASFDSRPSGPPSGTCGLTSTSPATRRPHTPFIERSPRSDEVEVVIVGGGIAGILAGVNLRKAGIERIRIVDQAGGIGGTWYWNRYRGVMCDVESYLLPSPARGARLHPHPALRLPPRNLSFPSGRPYLAPSYTFASRRG